jgi:hypothetical protein
MLREADREPRCGTRARGDEEGPMPKLPPQARMLELMTGHWVAQMIFAVTKLGVP